MKDLRVEPHPVERAGSGDAASTSALRTKASVRARPRARARARVRARLESLG